MKLKDLHEIAETLLKHYPDAEVSEDKGQLTFAINRAERPSPEDYKTKGKHPLTAEEEKRLEEESCFRI